MHKYKKNKKKHSTLDEINGFFVTSFLSHIWEERPLFKIYLIQILVN